MARHKSPPGAVLLKRLQGLEGKSSGMSLMLIALNALPTDDEEDKFWGELDDFFTEYKSRYEAEVYELSLGDRAILVKMSEQAEVGIISDIKVSVLRLIQQSYPEHFGMIDQARMLRSINLGFKLPQAIKFLEHYENQPGKTGEKAMDIRPLQQEDIKMVLDVHRKVGSAQFKKIFVQDQVMADIKPDQPAKELMKEYFIRMDALKKHVFANVELRGMGNLFNQLTITLDRVLISAFDEINPGRHACSVNLNVESVFTKAFEEFIGTESKTPLANIVFEFRQENILQQFDEFELAANLITSKGGIVAVDAIFPETIGLVNLHRLHATFAKIFWRPGAEEILPAHSEEIQKMQAQGLIFILARLDDEIGIKVGQDLGISVFQGFYIDKLMGAEKEVPAPEVMVD